MHGITIIRMLRIYLEYLIKLVEQYVLFVFDPHFEMCFNDVNVQNHNL